MNTQSITETDAAFAPGTGFNIAAAFPVTDEIVRKVSRAKWQARLDRVSATLKKPSTLVYLSTGILGVLAYSRLRR